MFDYSHSFEKYNSGESGKKSGGFKPLQDNTSTVLPLQQSGPDKLTPGETREIASTPDIPRPLYNSRTGEKLAVELMTIRPDIPVILCTGFSEQITEEKAHEMGIKKFILKPMVMNQLTRTVREVLDQG